MKPIVSVLMPVYNGEKFLKEAIESILYQTYTDFEFLIINDGSTDKSEEIILGFNDSRIRYIKNESNIKLIATLNKGIELSKGKYIIRMDADDISMPKRIEKQLEFMEIHPQIALCGSWFSSIGDRTGISKYQMNNDEIKYKMLYQCHLSHPSIIIRRDVLENFNTKFDPQFIHAEDYDLFVRISEKYLMANIQEVLLKYRIHGNSVSNTYKEIQNENCAKIRIRQFLNLGYAISNDLLNDFILLNYQDYKNLKSASSEIKVMLEQIIEKNNKSGYLNKKHLNSKICLLWFHYCYNIGQRKFFYSSFLSKSKTIGLLNKIKFLIKG